MTVFTVSCIAAIIILSIAMHEIGHAIAMKKAGVKIRAISLFGFGSLFVSWHSKFFDCRVGFAPIPLGAYVMPDEEDYEKKISCRDSDAVSLAGVRVNFLLAITSMMVVLVFYGSLHLLPVVALFTVLCSSQFILRWVVILIMPIIGLHLVYTTLTPEVIGVYVEKGTSGISVDEFKRVESVIVEGVPLAVIILDYTTRVNLLLGGCKLDPLASVGWWARTLHFHWKVCKIYQLGHCLLGVGKSGYITLAVSPSVCGRCKENPFLFPVKGTIPAHLRGDFFLYNNVLLFKHE